MTDNNSIVAREIVKQLKAEKLISDEENQLESKISGGTIREIEWKVIFESQIIDMKKQAESEAE